MARKKRVIITFFILELLLGGLWYWLSLSRQYGSSGPGRIERSTDPATAEAVGTIGSVMGTAMGALIGIFFIAYLLAAKADREAAARTQNPPEA